MNSAPHIRQAARRPRLAFGVVLLALAAGCTPGVALPPLPDDSTDGLLPAVKAQLDGAREAVNKTPRDAQANGQYAMALQAYDHSEPALTLYQRARLLAPRDPRWPYYQSAVYQRLGDLASSLQALDDALALQPDHVDVMAKRGEALYLLGRKDDARAQLEAVIAKKHRYPLAHYYLARLQIDDQRWQEAAQTLEMLLDGGLDVREVHQNLGVAYRALGDTEKARTHLTEAARDHGLVIRSYDPINMVIAKLNEGEQPHLLAARELYQRGNNEAAEAQLLDALSKNPDSVSAHQHLIRIYAEQSRTDDARQHFERVMELQPDSGLAYASWALALTAAGRLDEAEAAYARAAELDPGSAPFKQAHAGSLARIGRFDDALAQIDASLALAPGERNSLFIRGNALLYLNRYDEAIASLEQALEPQDDRTALIMRAIATAQRALGQQDEANAQMQAAAEVARRYDNDKLANQIMMELDRQRDAARAP